MKPELPNRPVVSAITLLAADVAQALGIPQKGWTMIAWDEYGTLPPVCVLGHAWPNGILIIHGTNIHFILFYADAPAATIKIDASTGWISYGCDPGLIQAHPELLDPIWLVDVAMHGDILGGVRAMGADKSAMNAFTASHAKWLRKQPKPTKEQA
jgi:imidazolonepropionase-like amidohydrolase